MSGVELADRARHHSPDLRVLYTSGYAEKALGGVSLPGEPALLSKPFSRAELSQRIEEVISREWTSSQPHDPGRPAETLWY